MWDVWDVGCSRCEMFGILDIRHVGCWGCGMFKMWDIGDVGSLGCNMWDVRCLLGCAMLVYKISVFQKEKWCGMSFVNCDLTMAI